MVSSHPVPLCQEKRLNSPSKFFRRRADLGDTSSGSSSQPDGDTFLSRASTLTLVSEDLQVSTQPLRWEQDGLISAEVQRRPGNPTVSIHPLPSQQGVLLNVEPPLYPYPPLRSHVPCDIVLVIDTSFSMSKLAPAVSLDDAGGVIEENAGFSVLDITKHAALTILESLDDGDRLGIVIFSTGAKVCLLAAVCSRPGHFTNTVYLTLDCPRTTAHDEKE
jgi:hypothetical protein